MVAFHRISPYSITMKDHDGLPGVRVALIKVMPTLTTRYTVFNVEKGLIST